MRIERVYVADDGTRFEHEHECRQYEEEKRAESYLCLDDYIHFYNRVGNPIPYSTIQHCLVYYARVNFIPNWNDNQVAQAWEDVVPEELANRIDCCGTGWYVSDGDDNWESWENYSAEYSNHNAIINNIVCQGI